MRRPAIKNSILKEVRKQCFFGCVFCGSPIFEYDHIVDYAIVKEHTVDNLVLLCPDHHTKKTKKILSTESVQYKRTNPFNEKRQELGGPVLDANRTIEVVIGSNLFEYNIGENFDHCIVWINGYSFFKIESIDGWILPSFVITDNYGIVVFAVDKGEIVMTKTIVDYSYVSNRIKIILENSEVIELVLTNYKVEINKAKMIDGNSNTGLLITPFSIEIKSKRSIKVISKATYNNNGLGIGVLDTEAYPNLQKPSGFGSFQYV